MSVVNIGSNQTTYFSENIKLPFNPHILLNYAFLQASRQLLLVASQFLHAVYTYNDNPYKSTYQYLELNLAYFRAF